MRLVLVYSGGLDSTVLLYHLQAEGHEVHCLGVDYGQRHQRELRAGREVCDRLGVEYRLADLAAVRPLHAGSCLTDALEVPTGTYTLENMKSTVVPNRNMILLAVAIGWAVSLRADGVAYAAHAGDHPVYPDCRPEFAEAMARAAALCDWHPVQLLRPFIGWSKDAIVKRGAELGVPFELTWSCYQGRDRHCGRCGTCVERRSAFIRAGIPDPTDYEERGTMNDER